MTGIRRGTAAFATTVGTIPRTTSGKLARSTCRAEYAAGRSSTAHRVERAYRLVVASCQASTTNGASKPDWPDRGGL